MKRNLEVKLFSPFSPFASAKTLQDCNHLRRPRAHAHLFIALFKQTR